MKYHIERSYYRIVYPLPERPVVVIDGATYKVLDCSEHGLRFVRTMTLPVEKGSEVKGVIRFKRGAEAEFEGKVVRLQGDQVAVHLDVTPIPMALIFDEQRHLRSRYPMGW